MDLIKKFNVEGLSELTRQIAVKNVVSPLLWALAITFIPLCILAGVTKNIFLIILIGMACFVIAITFCICVIRLVVKNPESLRSEQYQIRMNSIRLLGDSDNPSIKKKTIDNIVRLVGGMNNPELPKPSNNNKEI